MMSLFSSFDLYYTHASMFLVIYFFVMVNSSNQKFNFISGIKNLIMELMTGFFLSLKMSGFNKMFSSYFCTLFMLVFFMNFTSIIPFNFPLTSQMNLIMMVSLTSWFSLLLFQNMFLMKGFLSHCIPEGTPLYLTSLLFVIELVSNIIRPITMTVRLMANILAGHLLMVLLSKIVLKLMWTVALYFMLNMVELFVAIIQAYIFATMITLYYSEVN